jgi:hypothetical protein
MLKWVDRPIFPEVRLKRLSMFFLLCLIPFSSWAQPPGVKPGQIITLVFSSNVYGEYEPCG